jgi:hypothetical protein
MKKPLCPISKKLIKLISFFLLNILFVIIPFKVIYSQPMTGCYLGAYIGCGEVDSSCISPYDFNALTGKKHTFFSHYVDASTENNLLDTSLWNWANSLKDPVACAKPILFIMPMSGLDPINNGSLDIAYDTFAQRCAQYNDSILLIFGHEMNGNWYSWGTDSVTPQEYIDAFQHVYNIIKPIAPNVQFCWVPIQAWGQQPYTGFYPGDAYVDWVGLNVYDRDYDENNLCSPGFFQASFDYLDFYNTFSVQKNKPMLIGETALFDANWDPTAYGTRVPLTYPQEATEKNEWISQIYNVSILDSLYPNLNLVCYFHVSKMEYFSTQNHPDDFGNVLVDWRIPLDTTYNLYSTLIANSYFKGADTCLCTSINYNDDNIMECYLAQNFPNPFNSITTIQYTLPEKNHITLKIYDIFGKEVALLINEIKAPGNYEVQFDASGLNAGVYFCQLKAGKYANTKKMVLIK